MKRNVSFWIATWFGCGLAPKAPGTFGALGGLVVAAALLRAHWTPLSFAGLSIACLPMAIGAATAVARGMGLKDPQIVVVDEVLGQWLTLAGAATLNWKSFALAFLLFRAFDIAKPWPIRRIERLPEGTGIILDDMMAGVYAAICLRVAGLLHIY